MDWKLKNQYEPECFDALRIKEENLIKPMADKFVSVKLSCLAFGNVSGYVLSSPLPVVKLV